MNDLKRTSVPEQAILFYIRKYVDKDAQNNSVRVGRYVADIALVHKGKKYDIEYDSYSQHNKQLEKDQVRNLAFQGEGYTVIRMRDEGLVSVPNCINFSFVFPNYTKKSLLLAQEGLQELLNYFGIEEKISLESEITQIRKMYEQV